MRGAELDPTNGFGDVVYFKLCLNEESGFEQWKPKERIVQSVGLALAIAHKLAWRQSRTADTRRFKSCSTN